MQITLPNIDIVGFKIEFPTLKQQMEIYSYSDITIHEKYEYEVCVAYKPVLGKCYMVANGNRDNKNKTCYYCAKLLLAGVIANEINNLSGAVVFGGVKDAKIAIQIAKTFGLTGIDKVNNFYMRAYQYIASANAQFRNPIMALNRFG